MEPAKPVMNPQITLGIAPLAPTALGVRKLRFGCSHV